MQRRTRTNKSITGPLELPAAGDIETLERSRGAMFLVTDLHGDLAPAGAKELGFFHRDTRHLSSWKLRLARGAVVRLGSDASGDAWTQIDLMVSGVEFSDFLGDPINYLHIRRRQILDDALVEEITLTNFLSKPITVPLELAFGVDFADIFEVRGAKRDQRGAYEPPEVSRGSVTLAYRGLCATTYRTALSFDPAPEKLTHDSASYRIALATGETKRIVVTIAPNTQKPSRRARPVEERISALLRETAERRERSTAFACDDAVLQGVLDRSAADVHALVVDSGRGPIVGAGIPWYCSPFGRDSLLTAYSALSYNASFAVDALRTLAAFQGKRYDDATEEEPGKIFHEVRYGEMTKAKETPHAPYYGSVDATPLYVVVADAMHSVTGDTEVLRELRPAIGAALSFIDTRSENGTELVTYERKAPRGIDNQCWKDSRAGVSAPDGTFAVAPVAICEIQGYCIDAYARGARILRVLGEKALAEKYAARAESLRALFEERFWLRRDKRYAYAIDGKGRVLDTIVSNAGHLLWSGVVPEKRAAHVAKLLLSPASFSGFGIRTLAAGQAVYNPFSYHNGTIWPHDNAIIAKGLASYGHKEEALAVFGGLYAAMPHFADRRLPELFCGIPRADGPPLRYPVACSPQAWAAAAPFLLLQATLGIEPDAPGGRVVIRNPRMPRFLERVELRHMRVGQSRVSIRFRRIGERCHVEVIDVGGAPLKIDVELV